MLYTLAVILLIAWLLGVVGTYTIGAFVHVLLVVARWCCSWLVSSRAIETVV